MKRFQESIDQIERYLENDLDIDERKKVEKLIATNKAFASNFENYKFLVDGIKFSGRKGLFEKMDEWDEGLSEVNSSDNNEVKINNVRWYYAAAAIVFFVVAVSLIYTNVDTGYDRVVAANYTPFDYNPNITRGEQLNNNSLDEIFFNYSKSRYEETVIAINNLQPEEKTDNINFLLANAYQANGNFDEAIAIFSKFANSDNTYKISSKWYLALCYLSKDNPDKAVLLLNEIAPLKKSSYASKAQGVLDELK